MVANDRLVGMACAGSDSMYPGDFGSGFHWGFVFQEGPMNVEVFSTSIRRLEKAFERPMPAERKELISKYLKDLTDQQMVTITDEIIANGRSLPTKNDFMKFAEEFIQENRRAEEIRVRVAISNRKAAGTMCMECEDTGLVSIVHKARFQICSTGCSQGPCLARNFFYPRVDRWDEILMGSEWERAKIEDNDTPHDLVMRLKTKNGPPAQRPPPDLRWSQLLEKIKRGGIPNDNIPVDR